jgi:uncharacterized protein with HEPN domain
MNADPSRVAEFLRHILEAISRIDEYTAAINQMEFSKNRLLQDAVIRNFEILGEASRNIETHDPGFAARYPQIPLREIYSMRDRLSHGYFSVNPDIVWNTIQNELPALRKQVELALKDLQT